MRLISCWVTGVGTVPGRSSIHGWDGPKAGVLLSDKDGAKSRLVRYSFKPMFAFCALERSKLATSVFRQMPVIPCLGMFFLFLLYSLSYLLGF
jgi:hypothetical protein